MATGAGVVDAGSRGDGGPELLVCPFCDEPAREGGPSEDCPFGGEVGCPLAARGAPSEDDPLGETIAYRGRIPSAEDDGFPEADDLTGGTLGQYRIGAVIGQGAMGRVYRGEHTGLGR